MKQENNTIGKQYLVFGPDVTEGPDRLALSTLEKEVVNNANRFHKYEPVTFVQMFFCRPNRVDISSLKDIINLVETDGKIKVLAFIVGRITQLEYPAELLNGVVDTPEEDNKQRLVGRINDIPVYRSVNSEEDYVVLTSATRSGLTYLKEFLRGLVHENLSITKSKKVQLVSSEYHKGLPVAGKPSPAEDESIEATRPVSATGLLEEGLGILKERGATYDPTGKECERSMQAVVDVFNTFHGTTLTETQGYHFMQILKDVRLFSSGQYHHDSVVDCANYAALKGEAYAREHFGG